MSSGISFSGLGSGLDYSSWIDAIMQSKQIPLTNLQTKVSSLNTTSTNLLNLKNVYSSLDTKILKLTDSNLNTTANLFSQSKVSSSDKDILTVTSTAYSALQTLDVEVEKLATTTVAKGSKVIGNSISENSVFKSLGNGAATEGSLTFYVDNQKFSVDITKTDTLDDIKTKMIDATKSDDNPDGLINITISDGAFKIDAGAKSLNIGSSQDTSNFSSILALKKDPALNVYSSSRTIIDVNTSTKITDAASGFTPQVSAGTFKIGKATFTIDENTTLNSLIGKINSTTDAGVVASFDSTTGKLSLTSKNTGAFNISLENGTSNFLESVGLTNGNKLVDGTQKLGDNAKIKINGKEYESFSNTITSDTTGLTGLVFNLNKVTETDKSVKVKVEQDSSPAINAVKDFISEFNNVISKTDSISKSDSGLKYETSLTSLRNNLRFAVSGKVETGSNYKTLADIGITTGTIGSTSLSADTNKLQIDEEKFTKALQENPDAVKEILVGSTSKGTKGVITNMKAIVEGSLDATNGYFASRTASIKSQVTSLNDQITRKKTSLQTYKTSLTAQFQAMDAAISKLKSQQSQMSSILS